MSKFPFNRYEVVIHLSILVFFSLYALIICYPVAQKQAFQLSDTRFGTRDSHDIQWQAFRNSIPTIAILALSWKLFGDLKHSYLLGVFLCVFTFRADSLIYFGILSLYYWFVKANYRNKEFEKQIWVLSVTVLVLHQWMGRMRWLSNWMEPYVPVDWMKNSKHLIHWGSLFNMSMLKLISFGVDNHRTYYKKDHVDTHKQKCKKCTSTQPCLKARDLYPSPSLTPTNYLNYILFCGTFLAGPPTSYNNFHSFQKSPMSMTNPIPKFLIDLVAFQAFQMLLPVAKPSPQNTLVELLVISMGSLVFLWFKFLVIWRWARVWSYLCGVEVIDNMGRCVCNNYGFEGFWRMWHRGYNVWLVRYLFVPVGGNKSFVSYIAVFAFVAFWHDPELKMVLWVLTIIPFMLPQILVKSLVRSKYKHLYKYYWFKYLCAFAGSCYIYLMCIANLIGFGYGVDGVMIVLNKMKEEVWALVGTLVFVSSGVMMMFYQRHLEKEDLGY